MSGGRVGWNIVTGHLRGEHRAFGLPELPHDERYDRAEEYMDDLLRAVGQRAATARSWPTSESGIFADPSKVTARSRTTGKYFQLQHRRARPCPRRKAARCCSRRAASGRGQQFAMTHADVVFAIQPNKSRA